MNDDFQILINTPDQLKIHSPVTFGVFTLLLMLVVTPFIVLYIRHAARLSALQKATLIGAMCLSIGIPILTSIWSHTVTFSRTSNDVMIVDRFAGATYETRHYPLSDVREAIVQYARPGGRVALVMKSGLDIQPLGKAYNSNSMEYKAISLINDFVASRDNGQSGQGSPELSPHLQELKREIEETERKNAEAIQKTDAQKAAAKKQ